MYNPHWAYSSNAAALHAQVTQYEKLQQMSPYHALSLCLIYDQGSLNHVRNGVATENILFKDGHVSPGSSKYVYTQSALTAAGTLENTGTANPGCLDDYVDIFTTAALGRDPLTENADPATGTPPVATPYVNRLLKYQTMPPLQVPWY
jgi:hypothetical protein